MKIKSLTVFIALVISVSFNSTYANSDQPRPLDHENPYGQVDQEDKNEISPKPKLDAENPFDDRQSSSVNEKLQNPKAKKPKKRSLDKSNPFQDSVKPRALDQSNPYNENPKAVVDDKRDPVPESKAVDSPPPAEVPIEDKSVTK